MDLLILLQFDAGGCLASHEIFITDVSDRFHVGPKHD